MRRASERRPDGGRIDTPRMNSYDGVYSASFRYPPFSLDKLLQQQGWQIPEDMLTMGACRSPFNLKRYAMLDDGWEIVPAVTDPFDARSEEAKVYTDFVNWCFGNIVAENDVHQDFRAVLFDVLRANWDGFRVSEIGYRYLEDGPYAGKWGYDGFYTKHAKQIGFDIDKRTSQVRYITSYAPGAAVGSGPQTVGGGYDFQVPPERCLIYTFAPDANLPHGNGDWRGCYKHWWSLDNINRFWVKALERWGSPVLIASAPSSGLADAAKALDNIRDGASGAIPDNVKAQIVSAAAGVFDGYRMASMWHEQQIAKNIQHNTLSSSEGQRVGSMALGEVHQDSGQIVYSYGKTDLEIAAQQQIILRLCRYNFAGFDESLCPRLSLGGDDIDDVYTVMQAFDLAITDGVISKRAKFIRERLGWPPMDQAEEAMIEQEAKAEQEAQQQLADTRNSGKVGAMNPGEAARALDILTRAITARMVQEAEAA